MLTDVQTLMLTDVQTPFLGTPLFPVKLLLALSAHCLQGLRGGAEVYIHLGPFLCRVDFV